MTTNVRRYCVSLTANVSCGGTKKKSKIKTLATAAATAGPRLQRAATSATPARNIITMLASANAVWSAIQANTAHTAVIAADSA
jgi:hypothetical protein